MSTRRDFIKQLGLATAAVSLSDYSIAEASSRRKAKKIGPNEVIRLGVAGVNSRGRALAVSFAKMPLCEVVAICDCDLDALERCRAEVEKTTGRKPAGEQDYRKFVRRNDLDGIVIAMPDHWHTTAAIMALKEGKHVYLEKPVSHNPAENELLLEAARKYSDCVITVGIQRRSWPSMVEGMEAVRSGEIGEVHLARSWYTADRKPIGFGKAAPVPANLNWDFWQGPAPRREFKDNIVHYNWHWHWHWGTGEALNNGTHFIDLVRWGLDIKDYPTRVSSVGGRFNYQGQDDWECPDTQLISFQMGDKLSFSWEGRSCNAIPFEGMRSGVAFYGSKGAMLSDGMNSYKIVDLKGKQVRYVGSNLKFKEDDRMNPSEKLDSFHFQNWFDAIRFGTKLNTSLEEGCMSTQFAQYGNISQRLGRSLDIDSATGRILNDPEAMMYWGREYDKAWRPIV